MWFGTTHGLQKYDGYTVRNFEFSNSKFEGPITTAMIQNGDTTILLATWQGLWTFNLRTEQFSPFLEHEAFVDRRMEALAEDRRQRLWIGTWTGGLYCYDRATGVVRAYGEKDGLGDNSIVGLLVDHAGIVWIATPTGLNSFDPTSGRFVQYHADAENSASLLSEEVWSLDEDGLGRLWVGTLKGLQILNRQTGKFQLVYSKPGEFNEVKAITHDPSDNVWFEVTGVGLFSYSNGSFSFISASGSMCHG